MKFYSRNGNLWVQNNAKRYSLKSIVGHTVKYTVANAKKYESYLKDSKFFENLGIHTTIPTLVSLCELVLEQKRIKPTSYASYLSLFNSRIVPYFDKKLVTQIEPIDIRDWFLSFKDGSTLNTCLSLVRDAFEEAVMRKIIDINPVIGRKKPKFETNYKVRPFTISEVFNILDVADEPSKTLFALLFFTGMRTGEAIALKWEDIDLENMEIHISKTITRGFEQSAKTKSSIRTVEILDPLIPYLRQHKSKHGLRTYLFVKRDGSRYDGSPNILKYWKRILSKTELEYRSVYQTRHTFASMMLNQGENLMWVSAMLGHTDSDITLKKYGRYMKKEKKKRASFLDEYVQDMYKTGTK